MFLVPISTGTFPWVTVHALQPCPLAGGVENREGVVDSRVTVEQQVDGHAGTPPSGLGRATGEGGRDRALSEGLGQAASA